MLTFNNVMLQFPGTTTPLLDRVSLNLAPASITSLAGPNGSGKTTLLKLACGLLEPTAGSVTVAGHNTVSAASAARGNLGVSLYPERSFYYRLTCRQNLRYYSSLRGLFGRRCRSETDRVLQLLNLVEVSDVPFMRLSLGQRRRLGVARSLLGSPALVLLDEPTANLDDSSTEHLHYVLEEYRLRGGTVLLSTHLVHDRALSTGQLYLANQTIHHKARTPTDSMRWIHIKGTFDHAAISGIERRYQTHREDSHVSLHIPSSVELSTFVGELVAAGIEPTSIHVGEWSSPACAGSPTENDRLKVIAQ